VLEHITTASAVKFVLAASDNVAATITAHHLLLNRNALFQGGIRPHHYCLPVLKREEHRQALLKAATSGNPKFFLGTDSAPHARHTKENDCGCAGIYTAHAGIELYAEAFEAAGAMDKLEAFASFHGADFTGCRNAERVDAGAAIDRCRRSCRTVRDTLVPLRAGSVVRGHYCEERNACSGSKADVCGAVRYRVTGKPYHLTHCHCGTCRRPAARRS
jgi:dihydroorotase